MARLDDEADWQQLDDDERRLLRELAQELGMVFPVEDDDDALTYE